MYGMEFRVLIHVIKFYFAKWFLAVIFLLIIGMNVSILKYYFSGYELVTRLFKQLSNDVAAFFTSSLVSIILFINFSKISSNLSNIMSLKHLHVKNIYYIPAYLTLSSLFLKHSNIGPTISPKQLIITFSYYWID